MFLLSAHLVRGAIPALLLPAGSLAALLAGFFFVLLRYHQNLHTAKKSINPGGQGGAPESVRIHAAERAIAYKKKKKVIKTRRRKGGVYGRMANPPLRYIGC